MSNRGVSIKSIFRSELSDLAYSIWDGNANKFKNNRENALKVLVELHGQCESTNHEERCRLFAGHPQNLRHQWIDGNDTEISWVDPQPRPVTWKD